MSNVYLQDTTLTAIGNAIRSKTGNTELILPSDMPAAIQSIQGGGGGGSVEKFPMFDAMRTLTKRSVTQASGNSYGPTLTTMGLTAANFFDVDVITWGSPYVKRPSTTYTVLCNRIYFLPKISTYLDWSPLNINNTDQPIFCLIAGSNSNESRMGSSFGMGLGTNTNFNTVYYGVLSSAGQLTLYQKNGPTGSPMQSGSSSEQTIQSNTAIDIYTRG